MSKGINREKGSQMLKGESQQRSWQMRNMELGIKEQEEARKDMAGGGDVGKGGRDQNMSLGRHSHPGFSSNAYL